MDASTIQYITIFAIPLVLAITLHEASHAFAARYFGDSTAYMMGRMTLNPVKHIDPVWTIAVPLLLMLLKSPFLFGGAKPVPVNFGNLRNPKRDMIWVAAAGPAANLVMMILWGIVAKIAISLPESEPVVFIAAMSQAGIYVNALLMIFNLFPVLPLDGGRILMGLLPPKLAYSFSRTEPYGMFILVGLLMADSLHIFSFFGGIVMPLVEMSQAAIYAIMGISL